MSSSLETLTKAKLARQLHVWHENWAREHDWERRDFTYAAALRFVEVVLDKVKKTVRKDEDVKIAGFGKFEVRTKNARLGRNPKTGIEAEISSRRVVTFRPSQRMRQCMINKPSI